MKNNYQTKDFQITKDFQVNALRTKTKYKLTALRIGMKEEIQNEIKKMFKSEVLKLPIIKILEHLENKRKPIKRKSINSKEVNSKETIKAKELNTKEVNKINEKNSNELNKSKEIKSNEKNSKEVNTKEIKTEEIKTEEIKEVGRKRRKVSVSNFKIEEPKKSKEKEIPENLIKLPGLRRYNSEMESIILEDSAIYEKKPKIKIEITKNESKF